MHVFCILTVNMFYEYLTTCYDYSHFQAHSFQDNTFSPKGVFAAWFPKMESAFNFLGSTQPSLGHGGTNGKFYF